MDSPADRKIELFVWAENICLSKGLQDNHKAHFVPLGFQALISFDIYFCLLIFYFLT